MKRDPIPKSWTYVAIVVAVVVVFALPDNGFGDGVIALVVVVAIGLLTRALYFRTRNRQ